MEELFKREELITITLSKDDWIEILILAGNSLSYTGEDSEAIERLERTIASSRNYHPDDKKRNTEKSAIHL